MSNFKEFYKNYVAENRDILVEMPQYYPSKITYQVEKKFFPISKNNIAVYRKIGDNGEYSFFVHPSGERGFVFSNKELEDSQNDVQPAMVVSFRDTVYNFKQAHSLRIREKDARQNLATIFYILYVENFGGIVSDNEHLEGGKTLWRSLINNAESRNLKVFVVKNDKKIEIDKNTPDSEIWSIGPDKKETVIILQKLP
jgi:hypothetical protein